MTQFALIAVVALALYLALRVGRIKRPSMPFLVAYPLFVLILVGGGVAVFVGMSNVAVAYGLGREEGLAAIYGSTALALLILWFIAKRVVG